MGQQKEEMYSDRWSLRLNSCSASFACPGHFFLIAVWVCWLWELGGKSRLYMTKSENCHRLICIIARGVFTTKMFNISCLSLSPIILLGLHTVLPYSCTLFKGYFLAPFMLFKLSMRTKPPTNHEVDCSMNSCVSGIQELLSYVSSSRSKTILCSVDGY